MGTTRTDAAPDRAELHEAALRHLSRYSATEAGLVRVLERRIARWLRAAGKPPESATEALAVAREVARALVGSGVVDDVAFAQGRARRLIRAGRSRRAMAAHLADKGVAASAVAAVVPEDEFPAAMAFLRRRRFGPFRIAPTDAAGTKRELAALARAGFGRDVAERALRTPPAEAEQVVVALKQG